MVAGFSQLGFRVAGCGRSARELRAWRDKLGSEHFFAEADVADSAQVEAFAGQAIKELGPPDLLLNNAAIINPNETLWRIQAKDFDRLIDVNIKGVANMIRSCLPAMIAAGRGIVVNFSSGWGRSTSPEVAPYCASKWAIEGLSTALAQELPSGLACVALNPGIINTEMLRSCFGAGAGGYPTAEQWAKRAVPFLAELNSHCNGKPLTVP